MGDMIDTHIHLDSARYDDRAAICERSAGRGVEAIVVPGISQASNLTVLDLAGRFPGLVYAAAGLHPELPAMDRRDIDALADAVRRHRSSICAVGEVGLPYYGPSAAIPGRQALAREVVERAASLARELDLAIILHAPHETAALALQIVRSAGARRVVFHWHKTDEATTRAILDAGFFVSLTPEVAARARPGTCAACALASDCRRNRRSAPASAGFFRPPNRTVDGIRSDRGHRRRQASGPSGGCDGNHGQCQEIVRTG
jgi:TatD DNase family protein